MSNLPLIGRVAASRISDELHNSPPSRLLFGIIDVDPAVARALVKEIASIRPLDGDAEVYCHPSIVEGRHEEIGEAVVSDETATYFRNSGDSNTKLTVFCVPPEDSAKVRESLGHVKTIDSAWLADEMGRWAEHAMPDAPDALRSQLECVLEGLKRSGIVPDVSMYAEYVAEIERHRTGREGLPVAVAARRALPALRLPKNSGDMRLPIESSPEKAEQFFRKVHDEIRPALYLRAKDGESLNRVEFLAKLHALVDSMDIQTDDALHLHRLIENPNVGSGDWLAEQEAVARISWDRIERLFHESKNRNPATFGEETLSFFKRRHPTALSADEEDLLRNLKRDSATASDVHTQFFHEHETQIANDPKLYRRWEKLIYKKPVEADDLSEGLLRLVRQVMQNVDDDPADDPVVFIRLRKSLDQDFWTSDKNTRALRYLRDRYRGLGEILAPAAMLDFGRCWDELWDQPDIEENTSDSKAATTFNFEAFYVEREREAELRRSDAKAWEKYLKERPKAQLDWTPRSQSLAMAFPDDVQVLAESGEVAAATGVVPLLTSVVSANRYDKHGTVQTIDLDNMATLKDSRFDSNGHLANDTADGGHRIDEQWLRSLAELEETHIVTPEAAARARAAFDRFHGLYGDAIRAIRGGRGFADPAVLEQADAYGELLEALKGELSSQLAIRHLWQPLLRIGVAEVRTDRPMVIVSGFAPLRLAEAAVKLRQLSRAVSEIVSKYALYAGEIEGYIKETIRNLSATYYQDVALSVGEKAEIMVETVRSYDLSLMESPKPGSNVISDEPAEEIADAFDLVARDYLKLRPHEKANFSTMLLNSESEGLPVRLADHMANLMEKEPSLRCDLVLTHDDAGQLRRIYEQQNRRIGHEVDSALTSEAARNFLSRLRVGIISPDALDDAGKGHDIVILHGVISRKADVKWAKVPPAVGGSPLTDHAPASHSKKKPFRKGDTTSGTYLTSPDRNRQSQAYLDALHGCLANSANAGDHWIPLQEVEFQSGDVKRLMERAHRLAEWVMTFDRIADRRLLASDDRRILRYYSSPRSDHNVIVSTEIDAKKLGERLESDLLKAMPDSNAAEREEIVRAVHRQSASLSGAVVMRGAERVNHAHELLGLVLARRELDALLRRDAGAASQKTAWFFIDDYLQWLEIGTPRADIIGINFAVVKGRPLVRVVVGEAKFVSLANVIEERKRSLEQLTSTVSILTKRLVSSDGTINPLGWRARISDLVLEHIDPFDQIEGREFEEWIGGLRNGDLPITVSGHSLVFVHDMEQDPAGGPVVPDQEVHPAADRRLLAQWVFGRPSIARGFRDLADPDAPTRLAPPDAWPYDPYVAASERGPSDAGRDQDSEAEAATESEADEPESVADVVPERVAGEPLDATSGDEARESAAAAAPSDADPVPPGWLPTVWSTLMRMRRSASLEAGQAWLEDQAASFRNALQTEGQAAGIVDKRLTPNAAIITLDGATGVNVAWLERNATDLRTKHGIDISRITPLTGRIAVTVNRPNREVLHLSEAWRRRKLDANAPEANVAPVVGDKEMDGELLYMPLFDGFEGMPKAAPHTLVSGTTGSGKGILATNLMLDLCAFNSPDNLRLYLVDPKQGVDYGWLERMPHLEGDIIADKDHAVEVFKGLVTEMERRYRTLREAGVSNINHYLRQPDRPKPMPRIVLFFDEVANWMQDDAFKDEVTALINQLATKSRAAGIHIFMIYQRADNQVMSMQLRANLGNKLILRLGDEGSSKIALGEKGAERLLGQGHLIAKIDSDDKYYAQVPFLDPEGETRELAEAIIDGWRGWNSGRRDAPEPGS